MHSLVAPCTKKLETVMQYFIFVLQSRRKIDSYICLEVQKKRKLTAPPKIHKHQEYLLHTTGWYICHPERLACR